jgi:phage protein U
MLGTLIILGPFRFSLATAAPDEISRSSSWDWKEVDRIGSAPALQFTGPRAEAILLRGRIIPGFTGGVEQLAQMRALAGMGKPLFMVDGMGRVHGNWVIESVDDTGTMHFADGMPRISTFDVSLKKYDDGAGVFGLVTQASNLLSLFR